MSQIVRFFIQVLLKFITLQSHCPQTTCFFIILRSLLSKSNPVRKSNKKSEEKVALRELVRRSTLWTKESQGKLHDTADVFFSVYTVCAVSSQGTVYTHVYFNPFYCNSVLFLQYLDTRCCFYTAFLQSSASTVFLYHILLP